MTELQIKPINSYKEKRVINQYYPFILLLKQATIMLNSDDSKKKKREQMKGLYLISLRTDPNKSSLSLMAVMLAVVFWNS